MGNQDTKKRLIEAAKKLLTATTDINSLTARQISAEADTNLAMINYCFKSKDELLKIAVEEIVSEEFNLYAREKTENQTAKEQLRNLLYHVCDASVKFNNLTKLSISYILLNDEITLPYDVLPFIKKHFGDKKDETECKIIAYEMISIMQLIFYRSEDFYKYCGMDVNNALQLHKLIDMQLNLFLGENDSEE